MTNTFEPRKIINTCINIMLSIYEKNSKASFGFIGANGFNEDTKCTKRYRVYSRIVATYFSDRVFYHKYREECIHAHQQYSTKRKSRLDSTNREFLY